MTRLTRENQYYPTHLKAVVYLYSECKNKLLKGDLLANSYTEAQLKHCVHVLGDDDDSVKDKHDNNNTNNNTNDNNNNNNNNWTKHYIIS